jgi:hypothetical protein
VLADPEAPPPDPGPAPAAPEEEVEVVSADRGGAGCCSTRLCWERLLCLPMRPKEGIVYVLNYPRVTLQSPFWVLACRCALTTQQQQKGGELLVVLCVSQEQTRKRWDGGIIYCSLVLFCLFALPTPKKADALWADWRIEWASFCSTITRTRAGGGLPFGRGLCLGGALVLFALLVADACLVLQWIPNCLGGASSGNLWSLEGGAKKEESPGIGAGGFWLCSVRTGLLSRLFLFMGSKLLHSRRERYAHQRQTGWGGNR